jgi:hypothetical protein
VTVEEDGCCMGRTRTDAPGSPDVPEAEAGAPPLAGAFISITGMGANCGTPGVGMVAEGGAGGAGGDGGTLCARTIAVRLKIANATEAIRANFAVWVMLQLPCPLYRSSASVPYILTAMLLYRLTNCVQ